MKLENFFSGIISCDLYYTYTREKISTIFNVEQKHNSLLIFKDNDLYWLGEYIRDEDAYAIVSNWCKSSECWGIRDNILYAQRLRINEIVKDYASIMDMID